MEETWFQMMQISLPQVPFLVPIWRLRAVFAMNKQLKVYIIAIKRLYKPNFMVHLQNIFYTAIHFQKKADGLLCKASDQGVFKWRVVIIWHILQNCNTISQTFRFLDRKFQQPTAKL